jgi:hypothetical protein
LRTCIAKAVVRLVCAMALHLVRRDCRANIDQVVTRRVLKRTCSPDIAT